MEGLYRLCRICGDNFHNIAHKLDEKIGCTSLKEMLRYCTKMDITPSNEAPYALCIECRDALLVAYKLIVLYHKTSERWFNLNRRTKKDFEVEQIDVPAAQNTFCFTDTEQADSFCGDPIATNRLECDSEILFKRSNTKSWRSANSNLGGNVEQGELKVGNSRNKKTSSKRCEKLIRFKFEGNRTSARRLKEHRAPCEQADCDTLLWRDQRPKCCGCQAEFDTDVLLREHSNSVHKPTGDSANDLLDADRSEFTCDICYRRYKTKRILLDHKQRPYRTKQYQCARCGKAFRDKCSLTDHERVHEDERPFVCGVCSKTFAMKDSYRKHLRVHTVESDRFKCDVCGKGCRTKGNLKDHYITHKLTGRPLQCPRCASQFTRKSCLKSHMRLHTGDKPYKCELCEARYTFASDLRRHVMAHKGIKPFVCDVCSRAYPRKDYLAKHILRHQSADATASNPETGMAKINLDSLTK